MLSLLQNGLPKLAEVGIEARLHQIVQASVGNLGGWYSQQPLDTGAGRQRFAVIVCDEEGSCMEMNNGTEQELKLLRAVGLKPIGG